MRHKFGIALLILAFMLLIMCSVLHSFESVVYNVEGYNEFHSRLQLYEAVGVSEETLRDVQARVVGYLKGEGDEISLNPTVVMHDQSQPIFNEREILHMRDVGKLFDLERRVFRWALIIGILLFFMGIWLAMPMGVNLIYIALSAIGGWLLLALAFAAWGRFDFDLMFTRFHELLFDNDLWLLDPNTDAMIRMYPLPFFEYISGNIFRKTVGDLGMYFACVIFVQSMHRVKEWLNR